MQKEEATQTEQSNVLGIIGGSSLLKSKYFVHIALSIIVTSFGKVKLYIGKGFVFCQRHEADPDIEYSPPHLINKRAIVAAFEKLNVKRIVAFASVGSLKRDLVPGTIVFPDDFFNIFDIVSYHDDRRAHFVPSLESSKLRKEILELLVGKHFELQDYGVYCQTSGPRFETKSEIRFLGQQGHIVGKILVYISQRKVKS